MPFICSCREKKGKRSANLAQALTYSLCAQELKSFTALVRSTRSLGLDLFYERSGCRGYHTCAKHFLFFEDFSSQSKALRTKFCEAGSTRWVCCRYLYGSKWSISGLLTYLCWCANAYRAHPQRSRCFHSRAALGCLPSHAGGRLLPLFIKTGMIFSNYNTQ